MAGVTVIEIFSAAFDMVGYYHTEQFCPVLVLQVRLISTGTMKLPSTLKTPILIESRRATLLTSDPDRLASIEAHNRNEAKRAVIAQLEKIGPLRKWLGLKEKSDDPASDWPLLAIALAQKFLPGFRIKDKSLGKNRGRKKEWDWERHCQLMADVELLQREKQRSDREACFMLATNSKFKPRWGKYSQRTLRNKLIKARQEEGNVFNLIRKQAKDLNAISDDKLLDILVDVFSITKK